MEKVLKGKIQDVILGRACRCPYCKTWFRLSKKTWKRSFHQCPKCRKNFEV